MTTRRPPTISEEIRQTKPYSSRREEAAVSLVRTASVVRRCGDALFEARGLTSQQYNVLRILRGAGPRGLKTLEIADRLIEPSPGITRLVDVLEKKKLLVRARCETDRRVVYCKITASALTLLAELDAPVVETTERAMEGLTAEELPRLLELLDKIRAGAREAPKGPASPGQR